MKNIKNLILLAVIILLSMTPIIVFSQSRQENTISSQQKEIRENIKDKEKKIIREAQRQIKKQEKIKGVNIGMDLLDVTIAFLEFDEVHIPFNIIIGYGFWDNFYLHSIFRMRFPLRGGILLHPTIGIRAYSSNRYGSAVFLGANIGWSYTNVPWLDNGFTVDITAGYRYTFAFRMFIEGSAGALFNISKQKTLAQFTIAMGYII